VSTDTSISVKTAADGSYSIAGLATGTDYQVCFYASGATGGTSDAPQLRQPVLQQPAM
jgi:hypothetical protein